MTTEQTLYDLGQRAYLEITPQVGLTLVIVPLHWAKKGVYIRMPFLTYLDKAIGEWELSPAGIRKGLNALGQIIDAYELEAER